MNPALLSFLSNAGRDIGSSLLSYAMFKKTNAHLTGAQREANAFSQQMADKQMDFQREMSDTANQRAVADMQNAGLNPALMYGNGAAASTPTGSNASSVSPETQGIGNIVQAFATMKMMGAETRLKNSQAQLNEQKVEESKANQHYIEQNTKNAQLTYDLIGKNIEGSDLDNEAKRLMNKFNQDTYDARVEIISLDKNERDARIRETEAKIENLSEEKKIKLQQLENLKQQYNNLIAQENLTEAQMSQAYAMCREIDEQTNKIKTETNLTQKDIDNYDWNHTKDVSAGPVKQHLYKGENGQTTLVNGVTPARMRAHAKSAERSFKKMVNKGLDTFNKHYAGVNR